MNKDKIWEILRNHESNSLIDEVHIELSKHLEKNVYFYFEPKNKNILKNKLYYLENNILVYFEFESDKYDISYYNLKSLLSFHKSSEGYINFHFTENKLRTNPDFYKPGIFKSSLDTFYENILKYIKQI